MTQDDMRSLTDEQLTALIEAANAESARRGVLARAEQQIAEIQQQWAAAAGRADGDPWAQPAGAHDAYALDAVVTHNGKTWQSTTASNVWAPGVYGWEVVE